MSALQSYGSPTHRGQRAAPHRQDPGHIHCLAAAGAGRVRFQLGAQPHRLRGNGRPMRQPGRPPDIQQCLDCLTHHPMGPKLLGHKLCRLCRRPRIATVSDIEAGGLAQTINGSNKQAVYVPAQQLSPI
ncbi:hypothetical protein GWK47_025932 [Chionoecetes opilio]|uniref:Uncharacterized protein n=1 Tax=Chionoecetes opilio TaxID=41210 RepID=A0A8J8WEY5_CHIOP|nr:hypothetical protein GWK47_025932 [Chionoecetes opilio]